MTTPHAIIVITAADQNQANLDAATVQSGGDPTTFIAGLCPAGSPSGPITHYWCGWNNLTLEQWEELVVFFGPVCDTLPGMATARGSHMYDGNVHSPDDILVALNLTPWEGEM